MWWAPLKLIKKQIMLGSRFISRINSSRPPSRPNNSWTIKCSSCTTQATTCPIWIALVGHLLRAARISTSRRIPVRPTRTVIATRTWTNTGRLTQNSRNQCLWAAPHSRSWIFPISIEAAMNHRFTETIRWIRMPARRLFKNQNRKSIWIIIIWYWRKRRSSHSRYPPYYRPPNLTLTLAYSQLMHSQRKESSRWSKVHRRKLTVNSRDHNRQICSTGTIAMAKIIVFYHQKAPSTTTINIISSPRRLKIK